MNQILHIFKKDAGRHCPEILISLVLLGFSTRHELNPWQNSNTLYSFRPNFFILAGRYITPATILFWVFLIVRVVQDESLVGDRQWWVTKPYEWWNLLAAKLLFIFIFISVPLFHVHLLLLHQFRFPILPNLSALLLTQLALYFVLFLPALLLASLTKNFGQFLLTVGCILAVLAGVAWLATKFPSGDMESPPAIVEHFQMILLWGSVVGIPVWQFAKRRRWVSVAAFLGMLGVNALISIVVPDAKTVERGYRRVEAQISPAKIAIKRPSEMTGSKNTRLWSDAEADVSLNVPITVSGVAPGTMVMVDVMRITTDSPQDSKWSRGWKYQHAELWPEDQLKWLPYELRRKEYQEIKTKLLNLHLELALSEYQEADVRILPVPAGKFVDKTLGVCRVGSWQSSSIECLKPFHAPALMATFDAPRFPCTAYEPSYYVQEDAVSHAWEAINHYSFPDPSFSPIADYSIWFRSASLPTGLDAQPQQTHKTVILCPGSEIRLARPELKRQIRIELDVPNVRLQDFVEADRQ